LDVSTKPTGASLRAYAVGFGDCFLLTFHYPSGDKHVLIDFGSTERPDHAKRPGYMQEIAEQIATDCGGALVAVIATHRHADHISGFTRSGEKGPGAVIAKLKPKLVLQPWTEHPDAARDARQAPVAARGAAARKRLYLQSLQGMNAYASSLAAQLTPTLKSPGTQDWPKAQREKLFRVAAMAANNAISNLSAVQNLASMAPGRYLHHGAPSGLEAFLPGVTVHVLGPPTLTQEPRIETQTDKQADEFWHFRASFWARSANAAASGQSSVLFPRFVAGVPRDARWHCHYARQAALDSSLGIVRILDDAMNNTSLILLFEFRNKCLLFPGDAQWENWRYALQVSPQKEAIGKLLRRVTLYKVGHHGSLNATPKSLWKVFKNKGGENKAGRLLSVLSTKDGVHGEHNEVPREKLVTQLKAKTTLVDTRETGATLSVVRTV
jgi:hypothetical protein